jgi:hypothetical protein
MDSFREHFMICAHCKKPVFYEYYLKCSVWKETGLGYHGGVLHLPCVEELIRRSLTVEDFDMSVKKRGQSVNDGILWAFRVVPHRKKHGES